METFEYVIVGGGIAGTTAAETIRRENTMGRILIVSEEPHRLYSRVMLSKADFLLGKVPRNRVFLKNESWYEENNIVFVGGVHTTHLNPKNKIISLASGERIVYKKLLLALGSHARRWNVPGADKNGVCYMKTLDDGIAIGNAIKSKQHVVLIGSSCVSFEIANVLRLAGIQVTEVMLEKYFWEPMLDETSGRIVEKALTAGGVELFSQSEVCEVLGNKDVSDVVLKDGKKIPCDMIICGIGVVYPIEWLAESGISTHRGVVANEYLETSAPDVWTAGDVAEFHDVVLDETMQFGNWMNAREQGRIASLNMIGKKEPFKYVSFYISHGFGTAVAFTGDIRILPDRTVVHRGSPDVNAYTTLILKNGKILGGTTVNRTQDIGPITKLISNRIDVSTKQKELSDQNFNLSNILQLS